MKWWGKMSVLCLALGACSVEHSENGALEGNWRLVQVDTLATGGRADVRGALRYWAVQHRLLKCYDASGAHRACLLRFEHKGDSLNLYAAHSDGREEGDHLLESSERLQPYGLQELDERLAVEELNRKRMRLKGKALRLTFDKW